MKEEGKEYSNSIEDLSYNMPDKAHVIAVVGAGGKSTYIRDLAKKLKDEGKKVCITTTTHILKPDISDMNIFSHGSENIFYGSLEDTLYVGKLSDEEEKLSYPGDSIFSCLIKIFDYLLVEADGSKHLPAKIPIEGKEPVIPIKTDEIVVIMGKHAIGKKIHNVCHRNELQNIYSDDKLVTEEILEELANKFYIRPLSKKYPELKINYILRERKPAFIVMASGYARRFGENKLLKDYNGNKLYKHILYELLKAASLLRDRLNFDSELILVTRYKEILEDLEILSLKEQGRVRICINTEYEEGIAGSVRLGAKMAKSFCCTEYIYCAADMPALTAEDMYEYVKGYIYSGKHFAVMDDGLKISNPGSISSAYYDETMNIRGDRGGMQLIKKHPDEIYHHYIDSFKLKDIDTKEDLCV
ncbi:MAG: selenium cofactor biosynthesis protein YqeC [Eubacteriales bacterium]|nr:selenium cofactor biosynthesis protein YqeC [Eubacteriales bacterium]